MGRTRRGVAPSLFLTLAVATSLAIGSVGYISGSAPEWIVLKASIGMLAIGLMGWVVSVVMSAIPEKRAAEPVQAKGKNVDVTLAQAAPADHGPEHAATPQSAKR